MVFQHQRHHTPHALWKGLCWGTEEKETSVSLASDSGETKWFSLWSWITGPALYPHIEIGGFKGVCPPSLHMFLGTWKRHMTMSLGGSCEGCSRSMGCQNLLLRAIRSLSKWGKSLVFISGRNSDTFAVGIGLHFVTNSIHNFYRQNF